MSVRVQYRQPYDATLDRQNLLNSWRTYGLPALIPGLIFLFYLVSMLPVLRSYEGNYSGFVRFADFRTKKISSLEERPELFQDVITRPRGYDGQFYYYIALDPLLLHFKEHPGKYRGVVDSPRYRYSRIGFPLLIKFFSLNRQELYPQTMIWLILGSHLIGAFFLMKIAMFYQRSPIWALLYVLIPGFLASTHSALPEPIAAALLLGGIYFYLNERISIAVSFFALSILVRETGIICVGVLVLLEFFRRKRTRYAFLLCCSVLPYFLWKGYVTWRLYPVYGYTTFFFGPRDFGPPFGGMAELFRNMSSITKPALFLFAGLITINLLIGAWLMVRRKEVLGLPLFLYSLLHVCLNYPMLWSGIRSIERTTYEGFLFLILGFLAQRSGVRYRLLVVFAAIAAYDIFCSSHHASWGLYGL